MLAVVCVEPGKLQVEERAEPAAESGMVKLRIKRIGICGTDYHIYKGLHPFLEYPRVIGHELSGEVAEAPEGCDLKVGETVIVNPYINCGECVACLKDKPNCCSNIRVLGVHTDGGLCEYINVPARQLYPANGLSVDQAAMVEFLAIGAHGVRRGEVKQGDKVLVVGAGPIGLGAALFASVAGAEVAMLDISEKRIETAKSLIPGITGFTASDKNAQEFSDHTNGDLFDVVMDATGNRRAMESSITYVAHGGSCVFISVVKDDIVFHDPLFHSREMRLIGSRNATRVDFEHVIDCFNKGLIPSDKLLTHRATLNDAPTKIPSWLNEQDTLIKAVVEV